MIGQHLQRCKESRDQHAPQIFATIRQHHTGNHGWQIGQRHYLPDMSCRYDDEEIAAESPYYGTQSSQIDTEVKGTQQNIEAQQVYEDVPHILRQSQMVYRFHLRQQGRTWVRWRHLVGRHTSEQSVCPACALSCTLLVLYRFLSCSTSCRRVMTIEHTTLYVSGEEVGKRYHYE